MREVDLAPFWRSSIGFDRLFDLIDETLRLTGEDNYPPYNIAREGEEGISRRAFRRQFNLADYV
jgi:molecular chaperone IbpA